MSHFKVPACGAYRDAGTNRGDFTVTFQSTSGLLPGPAIQREQPSHGRDVKGTVWTDGWRAGSGTTRIELPIYATGALVERLDFPWDPTDAATKTVPSERIAGAETKTRGKSSGPEMSSGKVHFGVSVRPSSA